MQVEAERGFMMLHWRSAMRRRALFNCGLWR
jgi:hypothetical protein